jgi:peptidoglycan/xylan/chitin deacetylase (PgdA/CDA1 family)
MARAGEGPMIGRTALALASRGRLSVLIFHRVLPGRDALLPGEPTADEFDSLLGHLKEQFSVLPLSEAIVRLRDGSLPRSALAITFDDGYADNATVAAPLLRKHGLPATVFVATGYIDGGVMWNDIVIAAFRSAPSTCVSLESPDLGSYRLESIADRHTAIDRVLAQLKYRPAVERERQARSLLEIAGGELPRDLMMTSDMVKSLESSAIEIGAHTVTHPILARIPSPDAWREIVDSKHSLEALLGHAVALFAYPNGRPGQDFCAEHIRMAKKAGFTAAVSTAWGAASRASDPFQLPRFTPWTRKPLKFDLLMMRNLRRPECEATVEQQLRTRVLRSDNNCTDPLELRED